jgi:hypothetical protein
MPKFIIGYGLAEHVDTYEAPTLEAARNEAVGRSVMEGSLTAEESADEDWSWAIPYTEDKAWDLGLLDPPKATKQAAWWG